MENNLKSKNVLVTGGAGLVGSHVVERLLNIGANVFVVDIKVNEKSYFQSKNLAKKCNVLTQDIRDRAKMWEVVNSNNIDYIFHLAAQALVPEAYADPYLTLETNIMGTVSVLEAARLNKSVKGVIVASSDKAYGKDCVNVTEDKPLAGDHPYDVSKSATDLICTTYARTYNLPVAVSRFGNIFGPGDLNFNRIVPGIMDSLVNNKVLELRSDGKFFRDYVYVKDVADGYITLAEQIEKSAGQAFNFSSGHNFSVLDLISNIEKILGVKVDYTILNSQTNEIPAQSLNFEKVQKMLGWKTKYTFEQGIKETFEWYKKAIK